jgi:hypothetical protein
VAEGLTAGFRVQGIGFRVSKINKRTGTTPILFLSLVTGHWSPVT